MSQLVSQHIWDGFVSDILFLCLTFAICLEMASTEAFLCEGSTSSMQFLRKSPTSKSLRVPLFWWELKSNDVNNQSAQRHSIRVV